MFTLLDICTVWTVLKITRTVVTKVFQAKICLTYMLRQQQINQEIYQAIYEEGLKITYTSW